MNFIDFTQNGFSSRGNYLMETNPGGDRDISFYRDPGTDMYLCAEEVDARLIAQSRIFHSGSLSMTHTDIREATRKALQIAKDNCHILSSAECGNALVSPASLTKLR